MLRFNFAEPRLDQINKLLILSWIPLMPLAGWLVDHWGVHQFLFLGSMLLSLAISWLGLCETLLGLSVGIVGLAFAGAFLTTAGVTLMPMALTLEPRWSLAAALGLGFAFVGLATLLTPLFMRSVQRRVGVQKGLLGVGLLCLIPAALVAVAKEEIPDPGPALMPDIALLDLRFWLLALATCMYFFLERSLFVWPRPYLTEIGAGRSLARLLFGFWFAFLLFRFGLGWMIRQGNETWLVLVLVVVASMVLGNLAALTLPAAAFSASGWWPPAMARCCRRSWPSPWTWNVRAGCKARPSACSTPWVPQAR